MCALNSSSSNHYKKYIMAFIDTVKPWFVRKAKPTQAQFWQLFAWLRWKDETIAVSDITNLETILSNKVEIAVFNAAAFDVVKQDLAFATDGSYHIPRGWLLEKIIVFPGSDASVKIGNEISLDDIFPESIISPSNPAVINVDLYAVSNYGRDVLIAGVNADTTIVFLKRKIKELVEDVKPTIAITVNNLSSTQATLKTVETPSLTVAPLVGSGVLTLGQDEKIYLETLSGAAVKIYLLDVDGDIIGTIPVVESGSLNDVIAASSFGFEGIHEIQVQDIIGE
jgi:hypothetical protein